MKSEFKKEVFMLCNLPEGGSKAVIAKYSDEEMFNMMLARFQNWERQGRLHIIEVRNALYV
jgi:hypothetical protein